MHFPPFPNVGLLRHDTPCVPSIKACPHPIGLIDKAHDMESYLKTVDIEEGDKEKTIISGAEKNGAHGQGQRFPSQGCK